MDLIESIAFSVVFTPQNENLTMKIEGYVKKS